MTGDEPLFRMTRATDPDTSREAAASIEDVRKSQQRVWAVLAAYGPDGTTDQELVDLFTWTGAPVRMSPSGVRSRRAELVRMGLAEWTGEHRVLESGRRGRVWRALNR